MSEKSYYLGIDVGTGSARAGIFDSCGKMLAKASHETRMWRPEENFFEQSSEDIWQACCQTVAAAMAEAGLQPEQIKGIGFDATCSLVALDNENLPITISPSGNNEQNVIVWMDHRAVNQAERINQTSHQVLDYVGGKISPEMQSPKLLWLKENLPETWKQAARFLDLSDFLAYRATGDDTRSFCTTVCKWTYLGHKQEQQQAGIGGWDDSYWQKIGLGDLVEQGYTRIGTKVRLMGEPLGNGLTQKAASELGLNAGTPVGVPLIDAHAGGVGMIGASLQGEAPTPETLEERLALICGTSSCHMAVSRNPHFISGIWGPYFSAMVPGLWLNEGGQSATGALIDHMIFSHARAKELEDKAKATGRTVYDILSDRLDALSASVDFPALLTRDLHVLPYFHGNRSPHADPTLRGMISGLKLSDSLDDLALLYLATIQAIAHGTRHIIATMNANGYRINTIFACGGNTKNPVFLREHADITGCQIILPQEPEAVLLGSAILGAVASGDFEDFKTAMTAMSAVSHVISPAKGSVVQYHEVKHAVFHKLYENQMTYRHLMSALASHGF